VGGDAGLHVDRGQRVRDDVVQVAGDPQPLLLGAALRLLLACALGQLEPLEQQLNVGAAIAQGLGGEHGNGDEGHMGGGLQGERAGMVSGEKDVGDHHCGRRSNDGGDQMDAAA
jgi:hypothetical protein